jgi:hypothetical protein
VASGPPDTDAAHGLQESSRCATKDTMTLGERLRYGRCLRLCFRRESKDGCYN